MALAVGDGGATWQPLALDYGLTCIDTRGQTVERTVLGVEEIGLGHRQVAIGARAPKRR